MSRSFFFTPLWSPSLTYTQKTHTPSFFPSLSHFALFILHKDLSSHRSSHCQIILRNTSYTNIRWIGFSFVLLWEELCRSSRLCASRAPSIAVFNTYFGNTYLLWTLVLGNTYTHTPKKRSSPHQNNNWCWFFIVLDKSGEGKMFFVTKRTNLKRNNKINNWYYREQQNKEGHFAEVCWMRVAWTILYTCIREIFVFLCLGNICRLVKPNSVTEQLVNASQIWCLCNQNVKPLNYIIVKKKRTLGKRTHTIEELAMFVWQTVAKPNAKQL